MIIRWLYSLIGLFCVLSAGAQPAEWEDFGTLRGLGSDCVMDMAQDAEGRVWIATTGGLALYDGTGLRMFTRGRHPEPGKIIANDLNKVWSDPEAPVVWIATQRDGLDAYNYRTGAFTHYQTGRQPGCIVDNSVTSISPSRAGGIWLTSYMGGISHYNRRTDDFTLVNRRTFPGLVSDAMWCLLETADSVLYTGHVRHGISRIDLRNRRVENIPVIACFPDKSPAEDGVRSMVMDGNGHLWLGTEKGLACLSLQGGRPIPVPGIQGLVCQLSIARDTLWISTRDMGLWALDLEGFDLPEQGGPVGLYPGALREIRIPCFGEGETALVRCVLSDKYGNLWVGTDRKRVQVRLHEPPAFRYKAAQVVVRALERDSEGRLWAGTQSDGIVVTAPDGTVQTFTAANSGLGSNTVMALRRTPDGDMWIGTEMQGLYRWSHRDGTIHKVELMDNDGGRTIYVCNLAYWNKRLAVGTSQGLFLVDPGTEAFDCYTEKNSPLSDPYVFSLLPDRLGDLWCGSALNGLTVLRPDMSLRCRLGIEDGLPGKAVTSMLEGGDGSVWAASEDGLAHIRPSVTSDRPVIRVLCEEEGLAHPVVQALAETDSGRIVCSTPDGLYIIGIGSERANYGVQLCYSASRSGVRLFRMNAVLHLPDRRLLWAGDGSLLMNALPLGRMRDLPGHLVSVFGPFADGEYATTLSVPDVALADKIVFRYRLDGGVWNETDDARRISLGYLSGGNHRLETSLRFVGDAWTFSTPVCTVISVPFPWGRMMLWAGGSMLLLLSVGFIAWRRRRKRIHQPVAESVGLPVPGNYVPFSTSVSPVSSSVAVADAVSAVSPEPSALVPVAMPTDMSSVTSLSAADKLLLQKAEQVVDLLIPESDFDKNRLARELCMSPSTLYRRLKPVTGMSPSEYIRHRRLLRARQLLRDGHTVSETAALVGMSVTYLGRCYKEEFGHSPSEVRP